VFFGVDFSMPEKTHSRTPAIAVVISYRYSKLVLFWCELSIG